MPRNREAAITGARRLRAPGQNTRLILVSLRLAPLSPFRHFPLAPVVRLSGRFDV